MKAIRNHGGIKRGHHNHIGLNGRFDTIQAAILLAKFPFFENELKRRKDNAEFYNNHLSEIVEIPTIIAGNEHVFAAYTVRLKNRDKVIDYLNSHNIPTAVYYNKCLHEQDAFKNLGYEYGSFPVAEKASREVLSLPIDPLLEQKDQDLIVEKLKQTLNNV